VLLHPNLALRYKQEVQNLVASLNSSDRRMEAANILRSLIDKIKLTPSSEREKLIVDLHGDLAGILSMSAEKKASSEDKELLFKQADTLISEGSTPDEGDMQVKMVAGGRSILSLHEDDDTSSKVQEKMVAGAGFEPATFRL
jgi:hypothetical protein